ncbi:MAG: DnaJ domain-containing protein [Acidobacteriota bacterium]|nr:DnaJ domain-containing protein [Acidobacteriota bacterium]
MATLVERPQLKLRSEGELRRDSLPALLAALGVLRATGMLELTLQRLVRRFVIQQGELQLSISNAREDRLLEWLVADEQWQPEDPTLLEATVARAADHPLTGACLGASGLVPADAVPGLLKRHLRALLGECAGWKGARYRILPGKVDLGLEPVARWPALAAALDLDEKTATTTPLPAWLVARRIPPEGLEGLDAGGRRLFDRLAQPVSTAELEASERQWAARFLRLDLLVPGQAPEKPEAEDRALDREELERWLACARREDLAGLLGVEPSSPAEQVRRAYYRVVRRFHPDRFRQGPLASFHEQVETAFALVPQALAVLTDPEARRAWENRRARPAAADTGKMAADLDARARRAAAQGRRGDAVSLLEQALALDEDFALPRYHLALLLAGNPRRRKEALTMLETLHQANPTEPDYLAALALALLRASQPTRARKLLAEARTLAPDSPLVQALAGSAPARRKLERDPFLAPLLRGLSID